MYWFPLTLILLNKLCLPHPFLTVNQSDNSMLFVISIHKLNEKQCRSWSDGFFRSHLIWIYTVFKGNDYPGSAGQGLNYVVGICQKYLGKVLLTCTHYIINFEYTITENSFLIIFITCPWPYLCIFVWIIKNTNLPCNFVFLMNDNIIFWVSKYMDFTISVLFYMYIINSNWW